MAAEEAEATEAALGSRYMLQFRHGEEWVDWWPAPIPESTLSKLGGAEKVVADFSADPVVGGQFRLLAVHYSEVVASS